MREDGISPVARCLVLLTLMACGPGVYSAASKGPPLVTLHADVVTAAPQGTPSSGVQAAVLWASLPADVESCLEQAATAAAVIECTGTDFRPELTSTTVAVKPAFPAAFELPIHEAPPLEALGRGRLGYGLIVVLHDGNSNGELDLIPAGATDGPDTVLGTSLRAGSDVVGDYLVYREGEVPAMWRAFEVLAGCGQPPHGFFVMRLAQDGNALRCTLEPPEAALTLELSGTQRVRRRACQHAPVPAALPAPATPPPQGSAVQCWGPESVEVVEAPAATCRRVMRYDLGSAGPPAWWPCAIDPNQLELVPARAPLTPQVDELFTLHYRAGPGAFRLGDLRVKVGDVVLRTLDSTVIIGAPTFVLTDRDGAGLFSAGDSLLVSEEDKGSFQGAVPGPLEVRVWAEASDGRVTTLGAPLSWTP